MNSAEDRLTKLIDRLVLAGESAASSGAWDRVKDIAADILAVAPDDDRARQMLLRVHAQQALPEGHRAFVSVLCSDIVKSTDMTEGAEPETVRDVFRVYRQAAIESVEGMGGTVLQFQGDGIFACFGYPNVHEDDAKRAVLAGIGLVERMATAAPDLRRRHGLDVAVRVGVHTGTVVVAALTSGTADAPDIVGRTTNLTARLQAEAEPATLVISDATRQLVEDQFETVSIGQRGLKGIANPMEIFRVLRARDAIGHSPETRTRSELVVGRDAPRSRLYAIWNNVRDQAADDRAAGETFVALRGPAGIGKSRLAADLTDRVRADGGAVLQASCSPYHTNVALWPVGRMLERRLRWYPQQSSDVRTAEVRRRLEAAGMEVDEVLPLLAPLLGVEVDGDWARPEMDPLVLRAATLKALVDWLTHFARAQPGLMLVEDLHWADPTTVDLLGMLTEVGPRGVMVAVTSREPIPAEWMSRVVDIELDPLGQDDAAQLVAEMVAGGHVSPADCRLIVERGGGVPLFVQELARSALNTSPGEVVPARLQELLAARLGTPGIDLHIAQLAASLGSVFDEGILRELAGAPVIDALAQLQAAGIIEPVGDTGVGYRFRHVLLRDAAYETQVLDARRTTHLTIARLLEVSTASPGDMAIVAKHKDLAGDVSESIPAYIAAAQAAQAEGSHTEARSLLDRALELLPSMPDGDRRELVELMIRMLRAASVSSMVGYAHPDVYDDFQLASAICRRQADRPEIMPAQIGIWSYMLVRGEVEAATVALEPLMASVDSPQTAWFTPEIKSCAGYNALYRGDLREAHHHLEQAWAGYSARRAEESGASPLWPLPNDPVAVTAVALACVAGLAGRTAESAEWERQAVEKAEEIGFPRGPFTSAFVFTYLAWLYMQTGNLERARSYGRKATDIAEQHGFGYFTAISGWYSLVPGPYATVDPEAIRAYETAMDMVGHGAFRPAFLSVEARNHAYLGQPNKALETVEEALARAQKSGEWVHQPDLLALRADITAVAYPQRMEDVVADLLAAIDVGLAQGSLVLALRAANRLAQLPSDSRPGNWRQVLEKVLDGFPSDSASPELADARAILGH